MFYILSKLNPIALKLGDLEIRWYAICILTGALCTYLLARYYFKKGGYDPNIADDIIVIALPAGIIGARIWWCICDSGSPWRNGDFWGFITEFANGGLAIQGGVILGAAAGIGVVLTKYKNVNIFYAMDAVIPNILIAQAIGRWGNFFNQEVYGACVDYEALNFLPNFVQEQMRGDILNGVNIGEWNIYSASIECLTTQAAQPLFLYESLLNILGLVIVSIVIRKFWTKGRKNGDLSALYLVWYGVVRFLLEPLRNQEFIMNAWGHMPVSQITSILFIIGGILFMVALRAIPIIKNKTKHD